MNYTFKSLRVGEIVGAYYTNKKPTDTDTVIVYGIGAPILPDNGMLPDARIIMKYNVDLFVPDYIGYGRSDGEFTPQNCIKTFLNIYEYFKKGCTGINYYESYRKSLKYKRIIFIGRSFGGTYIPLLSRYNPEINELGLIYAAIDNKSAGSIPGEESNEDFLRSMKNDGYCHLYRGILSKQWIEHLENRDDLSPLDNISFLKDAKLFIGHGMLDKCIHYSRSVSYYKKILTQFPNKHTRFILKLYKCGNHSSKTSNPTCRDFLDWLGVRVAPRITI